MPGGLCACQRLPSPAVRLGRRPGRRRRRGCPGGRRAVRRPRQRSGAGGRRAAARPEAAAGGGGGATAAASGSGRTTCGGPCGGCQATVGCGACGAPRGDCHSAAARGCAGPARSGPRGGRAAVDGRPDPGLYHAAGAASARVRLAKGPQASGWRRAGGRTRRAADGDAPTGAARPQEPRPRARGVSLSCHPLYTAPDVQYTTDLN